VRGHSLGLLSVTASAAPIQAQAQQPIQLLHTEDNDGGENQPLLDNPRLPITSQNTLDFLTANTPGPITGVSGLTSATASILNPPTSKVPSGFANSGYVKGLQPIQRPVTGVGLGASAVTGVADIVGTVTELRQMKGRGWKRFGKGLLASLKSFIGKQRDQSGQEAEDRSAAKRLVVNSVQNLGDLGLNQVPTAVSSIAGLAGKTVSPLLGTLSAGAGMGISALVALRSLYRGHRAARHEKALGGIAPSSLDTQGMREVREHLEGQMNRRKRRALFGAAGATLGAVGGGLLLGGLLGASMLTPIGWALAAAGGLAAAGLGLHKLYRWHKKRKAGTLHVERERRAGELHAAATSSQHPGHRDALHLLNALDITPEQVRGDEGLDLLKRKFESW
jgi:hypothetical protein